MSEFEKRDVYKLFVDTSQMDMDNASLRARPAPLEAMREKLAKIDAELLRCRERVDDLRLMESLVNVDLDNDANF